MSIRQANLVSASVAILIGLFFIAFSIPAYSGKVGLGEQAGSQGAGLFPFWMGALVSICGIIYLRNSLKSPISGRFMTANRQERIVLLQNVFSMAVYLSAMPYLGFALSSFLFLVFYMHVIGKYRLLLSLLLSAITTGLVTYCFKVFLYLSLPRGFVGW